MTRLALLALIITCCKALLSCHTDADCDGKDVCKQFSPRGRRTCQNTTGSLTLGSDCKVQLGFLIDETCSQVDSEILIKAITKELVGNVQVLAAELQNVNFFTQIISVQLNLPQEKARKLREVFDI